MTSVTQAAEAASLTIDALQLTGDNLLVAPLAKPERTGRFFIPEVSETRERPQRGVVQRIGPGAWNEAGTARRPMTVTPGSLVFFGKYAGSDEAVNGLPLLLMSEGEVMMFSPAGQFAVVEHEDAKFNHLAGDGCAICDAPGEEAAKAALALERERLVAQQTETSAESTAFEDGERRLAELRKSVGRDDATVVQPPTQA